MYTNRNQNKNHSERGSALAMIILAVAGLAALSAAMLTVSLGNSREQGADALETKASYLCQAGLSQAMYQMQRGVSPSVGSHSNQQSWGGGKFWVSSAVAGANLTRLTASGIDNGVGKSQELVVKTVPTNFWTFALFGKDTAGIHSSVTIDSYNSTLGTYAAQKTGNGVSAHAKTKGEVGTNGDITIGPSSYVWGDATPGPGHTVSLGGGSVSGSTAPASSVVVFPPLTVPVYASLGALTVKAATTIPTGNRTYTNLTVNASKTLTINGPANIVISNLTLNSNAEIKINDANGPVTLTIIDNFILNSNSSIYPVSKNPAKLRINMLSDNVADPEVVVQLDTIDLASNSSIYGCIYAPEANVVIHSNFSLYGALMARALDLSSNCNFHFDENLLSAMADGTFTYQMVCWRAIPFQD